jgi:hypothetical protein
MSATGQQRTFSEFCTTSASVPKAACVPRTARNNFNVLRGKRLFVMPVTSSFQVNLKTILGTTSRGPAMVSALMSRTGNDGRGFLFAAAVSLAFLIDALLVGPASAHVKWFCAYNVAGQPEGLKTFSAPTLVRRMARCPNSSSGGRDSPRLCCAG